MLAGIRNKKSCGNSPKHNNNKKYPKNVLNKFEFLFHTKYCTKHFCKYISCNPFDSLLRGTYHHFTGDGTTASQEFLKDTLTVIARM